MNKVTKILQITRLGLLPAVLQQRVAAGVEHFQFLSTLDCQHVVDIGANCGQFALISRKCFPTARIDSFEPLAEPAQQFSAVFANDPNTHLHRTAIGASQGEATIHVSNKIDSSSLLKIGAQQADLFPGTDEKETRTIPVTSLTHILRKQDIGPQALLKIDVQGFELEVLKGCEELLPRFAFIYVECSFVELYEGQAFADEVIRYLQARQFQLSGIYNLCNDRVGRAVQADLFFTFATKAQAE